MLSAKIPRDLKLLKQLESFQLYNQLLEISVLHFIYIFILIKYFILICPIYYIGYIN